MRWTELPVPVRAELVRRLSQRQLDVLMLHLAGCGYERIATMLAISPRSVRTHLRRAQAIYEQVLEREAA